MKTNTKTKTVRKFTHEGGDAKSTTLINQLRRSVMSCMLWEKEFYESGETIASRIKDLVAKIPAHKVADIALEAREQMKLRHVPLLLLRELARHGTLEATMLYEIVQRPDEIAEFLSIYQKDGKDQPLSNQAKKGLAKAFTKFDEYRLGKYAGKKNEISLSDAIRMVHPKPLTMEQASLFRRVRKEELATPDTWETNLSAGADKKTTFERLILDRQLGGLALLRNLRNMEEAGVNRGVIREAIASMDTRRILPFRFIAAARYAPSLETDLEKALFRSLEGKPKLEGNTLVLVDVSGSMDYKLSAKSDMTRLDAACGVAMVVREQCEAVSVITFSERVAVVPARRGFALRDAITGSQHHSGTYLGKAIKSIDMREVDRLIVITDEQSHDKVPNPGVPLSYMINVASAKNGVGYGDWTHIDGFSEAVISFIQEIENF